MPLFTAQLDAQLSQGDVFRPDWDNDRTPALGSVVVLSEGCDIDQSPDTILVADTVGDADTELGLRSSVQAGKVWRAFYLDALGRWVDLRTIRPVAKALFDGRLDRRLASMTDEGRNALAGKVFSFLTHRLPPRKRRFIDDQGVVWDLWEVRQVEIRRREDQFRRRISPDLENGWLFFTSPSRSLRLSNAPFAWQYLTDEALVLLLQQATGADMTDTVALAIEQAVRPS